MENQIICLSWYYAKQTLRQLGEYLHWQKRVLLEGESALLEYLAQNQKYSHLGSLEHWEMIKQFRGCLQASLDRKVRFTYPGHSDYPAGLLHIDEPAYLLSFLGEPIWKSGLGFSVVGSREPSELSLQWMERELGQLLSETDWYVVSGGARGVDQKAHALALRHGRATAAILPSGLGKIYPQSLESWVDDILGAGGVLVSEYGYNTPMSKFNFVQRNRLIPALSAGTLLVEARRRSGTLITAKNCVDQHKTLYVVPSHPFDNNSRGGLDLITEGATLVRDCYDLKHFLHSEMLMASMFSQSKALDIVDNEEFRA